LNFEFEISKKYWIYFGSFGFRSHRFPGSGNSVNNLTSGQWTVLFFRSGGSSLLLLLLPLLGLLLTSTTSASAAFSQLLVISDTDHGIFVSVCDRFDLICKSDDSTATY
jgi:hypothetical protein